MDGIRCLISGSDCASLAVACAGCGGASLSVAANATSAIGSSLSTLGPGRFPNPALCILIVMHASPLVIHGKSRMRKRTSGCVPRPISDGGPYERPEPSSSNAPSQIGALASCAPQLGC